MKVEHKKENGSIDMNELGIGETGTIVYDYVHYLKGHIVLRTFSGFVDLSDPQHTWVNGKNIIKVERKEFKLVEV